MRFSTVSGLLFILFSGWTVAAGAQPAISQSGQLRLGAAEYLEHLHLQQMPRPLLRQLADDAEARREFALDVHSEMLLYREAESLGLAEDPAVKRKLERARQKFLIDALMAREEANIVYPDLVALAEERYRTKLAQYRLPEKRKVAHILIGRTWRCGELPRARSAEEMAERLEAVETALKEGADFAALAARYSDDPNNADSGGLIDIWIEREKSHFAPGFKEALFQIEEVGGTALGETKYGVHVIKLVALEPSVQLTFEQVKDAVVAQLRAEYRNSALQQKRSAAYPDPKTIDLEALGEVIEGYIREQGGLISP